MLIFRLILKLCLSIMAIVLLSSKVLFSQSGKIVISEFMAVNNSTLTDEEGDFSDWIELHNSGSEDVNLNGWYLTDESSNLIKYKFPNILLAQGEYMVVFASNKNIEQVSSTLHVNFKLSGSGEFLALVESDGTTISSSFDDAYPAQQADISYGLYNGQYVFMPNPTPGKANEIGDNVLQPTFSHERGFYSSPFNVVLSSVNSNCDIYYTTDGNRPTLKNGIKYTSPIAIDKTTVLSAVSIDKSSSAVSELATQSYLFIDNIMTQPNDPAGYPTVWGEGHVADYEMDPDVCSGKKTEIEEALKAIPTISLVTNVDHLFYDSDTAEIGGLYMNTTKHTEEWERPVSMEYFDSELNQSFQVNCGLRIHGGNSRKPGNSPKHGFRVSFRSKFGPSKLNFNMFDEKKATNEFNSLVLRAGYNYSWIKNSPAQCEGADYIRDPFAKKTQLDMDRTAAHRKYVHLYLNGMYWGVYDITEKITNDFIESYLGGKEDDFDIVKDHNGVVDGEMAAWDSLLTATSKGFETNEKYYKVQGKNADGSDNESYLKLLDVRNFVDYMIVNFYMANGDWDRNNWLAGRNRVTNEHGFKFFCWDAETSMNGVDDNIVDINNVGNPSEIYTALQKNKEFKLFFADRLHKHFFNNGALTPAEAERRYMEVAAELDKSLLAESARWGDYRRDVEGGSEYALYTNDGQWQARIDFMQDTYLPQRTDIVFNQFKDIGLYPDINAPVFSLFGGEYADEVDLSITADGSDQIYYTIDDTDPREIGGAISINSAIQYLNTIAINKDVIIKARAKKGNEWSALTRAKFKISLDVNVPILLSPANAVSLESDQAITFKWSKLAGSNITYSLYLIDNGVSQVYSASSDTSYVIVANTFEQNKTYTWKVVAIDGTSQLESSVNTFSIKNIAPGAFNIASHTNGDIIDVANEIVFNWTKSQEVEDISYKLSITSADLVLEYDTQDTLYTLPANTLKNSKSYNVQVAATDGKDTAKTLVVELNTLTGVESLGALVYTNIYPNPATDNINVEIQAAQSSIVNVDLCDITGRILQSNTLKNIQVFQTLMIDMLAYRNGVYLVVLKFSNKYGSTVKTEKIIKK